MTAIAYTFPIHQTPALPRVSAPAPPHQAAVYRRRRAVVALSLIVVTFVLGLGLKAAIDATLLQPSQPALIAEVSTPAAIYYTVQPGDTLWSIASAAHPGQDPRPIVAKMQAAGASSALQVGDVIAVP